MGSDATAFETQPLTTKDAHRNKQQHDHEHDLSLVLGTWDTWALILIAFAAITICYADRSNISTAIIPMSQDHNWSNGTQGIIMSAFYYGYAVAQVPAGWLGPKIGGMPLLLTAVIGWSAFTALTPPVSASLPALLIARVLLGLFEGVSFPAIHHLVSRYVSHERQSTAIGIITAGSYVGTVLANFFTPLIIDHLSWHWSFYIFAAAGGVWVVIAIFAVPTRVNLGSDGSLRSAARRLVLESPSPSLAAAVASSSSPSPSPSSDASSLPIFGSSLSSQQMQQHQRILDEQQHYLEGSATHSNNAAASAAASGVSAPPTLNDATLVKPPTLHTPWLKLLLCRQVWAIIINQFCSGYGFYVLLNWIPSYYTSEFGISVDDLGYLLVAPYIVQGAVGICVGYVADMMITRNWFTPEQTRRIFQVPGMVIPGALLLVLAYYEASAVFAMVLLTVAQGANALTLAGVSTYQLDFAPHYAGVIFAMGNTAATIAGIIGVSVTGYIHGATNSWLVVFWLTAGLFLFGAVSWLLLARGPAPSLQLKKNKLDHASSVVESIVYEGE